MKNDDSDFFDHSALHRSAPLKLIGAAVQWSLSRRIATSSFTLNGTFEGWMFLMKTLNDVVSDDRISSLLNARRSD